MTKGAPPTRSSGHRQIREQCGSLHRGTYLASAPEGDNGIYLCHNRRVTDEKFTLWVVMFQLIFQGSAYEAASNNSNVDHIRVVVKIQC